MRAVVRRPEQGGTLERLGVEAIPADLLEAASLEHVDMEDLVRASGLDWRILRGALFYEPGTGRDEDWRAAARAASRRAPGDGSDLMSLIHIADMARALPPGPGRPPARSLYNVVDDQPVATRELYGFVAAQVGAPAPASGGDPVLPSLGCSNARLKAGLGWTPAYTAYRSGLA